MFGGFSRQWVGAAARISRQLCVVGDVPARGAQRERVVIVNILRCEHCASTDLTRLSDGEYRCNHCKASLHITAPAPVRPAAKPSPPSAQSTARTVALAVLTIGGLVALVTLRVKLSEQRRQAARSRMIQRSVAASLEKRFGTSSSSGRSAGSDSEALPKASSPQEFGGAEVEAPKVVRGTFDQATELPDRVGNLYIVGLVKNTGEAPIDHPRVEATLWDAQHHKLAVGMGFTSTMNLLPGEEFPIKLLVSRAPKYASVSYQFAPKAMTYGSPQRFDLAVESAKLAPTSLGGYNLTGRLRNKDKADVQHVRVVALLFGADQKIVGMQDGILSQQTLPAGDECPFSVNVFSVAATPKTFRVYTSAMAAR